MKVELGGLTIETWPTGTPLFKLQDLENYFSPPPWKLPLEEIPLADGLFDPGRAFRSGKRMNLIGVVYGVDAAHAEELAWEKISGLFPRGYSEIMMVTTERGVRTMRVWPDQATPQVLPFTPTSARFRYPLVAPDPRKYGPLQTDQTSPAGDAADGLIWPLFPGGYLDFGSFSPTGTFYITNTGTADSWPTFTVQGGITTGFEIVSGSDARLTYAAGVAAGTDVFLSPYAGGRAYVGATDSTTKLTVEGWPIVKPGETRQFSFNPLGTADANALATWSFSEAWW